MPALRGVKRIETDGLAWIAIRVGPSPPSMCAEFVLADDLTGQGFRSYCPTGARFVTWDRGRRCHKTIRQFPVFPRYIFAGLSPGQHVRRNTERHVESVLSDSNGPLTIPPAVIRQVNDWELAGEWDSCRSWREKSPYRHGVEIEVVEGPFAGSIGAVDALLSETRIRALIVLFNCPTPVNFRISQLRPSAK